MDYLPDIGRNPDYGLQQAGEFRVQSVSFGDGYTQRRPDGLNSVRRVWSLEWTGLNVEDKNTLIDFLVSKKGAYAFLWEVSDTGEVVKVVCGEMPSYSADTFNSFSVQAKFTEDFSS